MTSTVAPSPITAQLLPLDPQQAQFVADRTRFLHLVGLPGDGRTHACCAKAAEYALSYNNVAVLYVVPVADTLYHIARLLDIATQPYQVQSVSGFSAQRYAHEIRLKNGSVIFVRLVGDPTSVRTLAANAICVDDYDHCHPGLVRLLETRLRSFNAPPQMWITRRFRPGDRPDLCPRALLTNPDLPSDYLTHLAEHTAR